MNTDIRKLLSEIKESTEWSETRIAREIGTSQPTVNRLINGQLECKSSTWRAIVDLNARVKAGDVPSDTSVHQKTMPTTEDEIHALAPGRERVA